MKIAKRYQWILSILGGLAVLTWLLFIPPPFKGNVESISFSSDIPLEGVLTTPEGPGPHPAIILLHGAGSQNQAYDKPYFKFHANAFLEKGFAVLVYTKRGSGTSDFNYRYFTYQKLLKDAKAAVAFLKEREDIDHTNIGVMGVSESGWFTPELAYREPSIKFIINRVSSPFDFIQTNSHEVVMDAQALGYTQEEIDEVILPVNRRIWQFYIDVYKDSTLANGPERTAINSELTRLNEHKRFKKLFPFRELEAYDALAYEASAKRFLYDPMPYFNALSTPLFYVMAGKDKNIPTKKVVDYLHGVISSGKKHITVKEYPEASHYLYKYGLEDGPFDGWLYYDDYLEYRSAN